jgi:hypothetical protein
MTYSLIDIDKDLLLDEGSIGKWDLCVKLKNN